MGRLQGRRGASFKKEMIETGGQRVADITGEKKGEGQRSKTALFIIRPADGKGPRV